MVWLWLTNLVLLMAAEADAELEMWRGEQARAATAAGSTKPGNRSIPRATAG